MERSTSPKWLKDFNEVDLIYNQFSLIYPIILIVMTNERGLVAYHSSPFILREEGRVSESESKRERERERDGEERERWREREREGGGSV